MINFKFNFHNVLAYNRTTFNKRVVCCVDFIREFWQPVEKTVYIYSPWSLPLFTVVMMISVWTNYNYDDYKVKICAEKVLWIKKVLEYFLQNDVIITCLKTWKFCVCITKRDLNNIQKKNTFLRCKDLRVSWDLKTTTLYALAQVWISTDL